MKTLFALIVTGLLVSAASANAEGEMAQAIRRCGGVQKCLDGLRNETLDPHALIACFAAINRPSSPDWEQNNKTCEEGLQEFNKARRRDHKSRR